MDAILKALPNGGAVVAIILVVYLYLKHSEHREDRIEVMIKGFTDEVSSSRKDYLESLSRIIEGRNPQSRKP